MNLNLHTTFLKHLRDNVIIEGGNNAWDIDATGIFFSVQMYFIRAKPSVVQHESLKLLTSAPASTKKWITSH